MKRILLTAMAVLLLVFLLASCGEKTETPPEPSNTSNEALTDAPTAPVTKPSTEAPTEKPTTETPDKPNQPKMYEIVFHPNGGSDIATIRAEEGALIEEPEKPTQEGKKFVGWCTDEELTVSATFPLTLTKNTELWAKWNTVVPIKDYLKELTEGYKLNPYSYIPRKCNRPVRSQRRIQTRITAISCRHPQSRTALENNGT